MHNLKGFIRTVMAAAPAAFISHGGPSIGYETEHKAHKYLQKFGQDFQANGKNIKGIIGISAHWEAGKDYVQVNVGENEELIYDFYNFPREYYTQKYPNKGNTALAHEILSRLQAAGIKAEPVKRGLDHGIWVPFKIAFSGATALDIPIVTVSLFSSESVDLHYRLGKVLGSFRDEGIAVIGGGMSVHNMGDFKGHMSTGRPSKGNYGVQFHARLKDALAESPAEKREEEVVKLMEDSLARQAHPTFEHFMPLPVVLGAAGDDKATVNLDYVDPGSGGAMGYMCVQFDRGQQ